MARLDFFSQRFNYSFGPHTPTLTVDPGSALRVICPDCDNTLADGQPLPAEQRCSDDPTNPMQGNPLAGPIFVRGAEPGDVLAVTIDHIELDRSTGLTLLAPNHGVVPSDLLRGSKSDGVEAFSDVPRHMYHWSIDREARVATIANPLGTDRLSAPLKPLVGCIGVCPDHDSFVSSLKCGSFGGNLDLPFISSGATLFLPLRRTGGLLMLGDVHAAQGHGEIIGGGIETSGVVDCTLQLLKGRPLDTCVAWDADALTAVAVHDDLRQSIQRACAALVCWLTAAGEVNQFDLYNLISQTATITLGNLNHPPYPTAASVDTAHLPARLLDAMHRWRA